MISQQYNQEKIVFESKKPEGDTTLSERTDRLNALARKEKAEGLSAEEKAEQQKLRDEFRAAFRRNFEAQLENTVIETPEGRITRLQKKDKE